MKDKRISIKINFDEGADISIIGILEQQGFKNFDYIYHDAEFPKKGESIKMVSCDKLTDDWTLTCWKNKNIANLPNEEWRPIATMPHCMVSNMGRIKTTDRIVDSKRAISGKRFVNGKIMTQTYDDLRYNSGNGTMLVQVNKKQFAVATLVGKTFIDREGHMFKHINGNNYDNRVANLELINKIQSKK